MPKIKLVLPKMKLSFRKRSCTHSVYIQTYISIRLHACSAIYAYITVSIRKRQAYIMFLNIFDSICFLSNFRLSVESVCVYGRVSALFV